MLINKNLEIFKKFPSLSLSLSIIVHTRNNIISDSPLFYSINLENFIFLNDKQIYIEDWSLTVLQFCEFLNISVPRFCYHDKLSIAGNCRMCMVEVKSSFKPIISCATSLTKNMQIHMNSLLVKQARENVIEFLLINHPLDCPICDQGSECDLQDQTMIFGSDRGRFIDIKRSVTDLFMGPVVKTIMTRCIHCTRCIRFSSEIIGNNNLGTLGRGKMTEVGTYYKKPFIDELSGNVVDLCPVGALTSRSYAFRARAWELKSIESIDIFDSLGSNIRVDVKGNEIMRILPKRNDFINEEWITDKIRFSYEAFQKHRIFYPMLRSSKNEPLVVVSYNLFFSNLINKLQKHLLINNNLNTLFSIHLSNYFTSAIDFFIINNLFSSIGISNIRNSSFNIASFDFRNNYLLNNNLNEFDNNSLFLLNNINLKKENPILNSRIKRLKFNNGNKVDIGYIGSNINLNYDFMHISNSNFSYINILEGKHFYSNYLYKHKNKKVLYGINSFKNNVNSNLFNNILNKLNITCSNILPSSSLITLLELGYSNNLNIFNQNTSKINYLYNAENSNIDFSNSLEVIYHGTNINEELKRVSTFILPSSSIYENKLIFSNSLGFSQKTNISVSSIKNQLFSISELFLNLNNELFKSLFKLTDKKNNYLTNIIISVVKCNSLINNSFKLFFPYYKVNSYFNSRTLNIRFNYISNIIYTNNVELLDDYYKTDNVSIHSDTLSKSALLINNNKNNFNKNLMKYEYLI